VHIVVRGAGGHGSAPHRAQDPVPAACEMVTALQTFVTRSFDPFDPVVLSVCRLQAGSATNVIPDRVELSATVRSFSTASHERVREGVLRTCAGVAQAHGLEVEIDYCEQYPVTSNDAAEAEFAAQAIAELHGEERFLWAPQPGTGSEDFCRVLDEVPGAFVMLGACPQDRDPAEAAYNHSPLAAFDDRVLSDGAAVYADLAARRLTALVPA
jgi:hippurate hydrolase